MADEYKEITKTVAVPHAVGLTGILKVLEGMLKTPRMQEINITLREIRCRYFLKDAYPLDSDFVLDLPEELRDLFNDWAQAAGSEPPNT